MILMENGKMDSDTKIANTETNHLITDLSLSGKAAKPCFKNDCTSAVTSFQNTDNGLKASITKPNITSTIENSFVNCNGNAVDGLSQSSVLNGDDLPAHGTTKKINSSQCSVNSANCSLENDLSALSIRGEVEVLTQDCSKCSQLGDSSLHTGKSVEQSFVGEPSSSSMPGTSCAGQDTLRNSHSDSEKDDDNTIEIMYISYESENQMPDIMKLIQKDLSEPYSIYTYRYFIHNWPHLCFLAICKGKSVGAIVCKLDLHRKVIKRGYIAMLAVDECYRKQGIGSNLVLKAIRVMAAEGADEVVLETEITNQPALRLYENLGFVRDKRLFRYYLNGVDALRLKLWLR